MRKQCSREEFEKLKKVYAADNEACKPVYLYHLGSATEGAGVYSELGSMLECICYCHKKGYQFQLYADDCNFTAGRGFEEFFDSFCIQNHHKLNAKYNHRYPSPTFRRKLADSVIKKIVHADYLMSEQFYDFIGDAFQEEEISWPALGMQGKVITEKGKLLDLAMHYNDATWEAIQKKIETLHLPEDFISVQMRGGDKVLETEVLGAEEYVKQMEASMNGIKDVFVFTDDYRYIESLREIRPHWNVFTLAREEERGFFLKDFNQITWEEKKEDMIKLFAMMEICYSSKLHFGYEKATTTRVIKAVRMCQGAQTLPIE